MARHCRRFWWVVVGAFLLLLAACAPAVTPTPTPTPTPESVKVSLALDWYPNANHAGLFIAREKGYFREEGLEVDIFTPGDPATVLQTVASGRDDFGISYQVEVLLARQEEVPVVSVMGLVQHPLNSVMTLKESGLERPGALKGKKVGYPGIAYNIPMLKTMMEYDGASIDDVEVVNVGWSLVPSLIGRKVDAIIGAYVSHESILAENEGYPVNVMRMEEWGVPDFYELVLVTSESNVAGRPHVIQRFVRAVIRGYEEAIKTPDAAIDLLKKAHPEMEEEVERPGIKVLVPLWRGEVSGFGWQEEARWTGFADWMKANDLLETGVDARQAFTNRFVKEALATR